MFLTRLKIRSLDTTEHNPCNLTLLSCSGGDLWRCFNFRSCSYTCWKQHLFSSSQESSCDPRRPLVCTLSRHGRLFLHHFVGAGASGAGCCCHNHRLCDSHGHGSWSTGGTGGFCAWRNWSSCNRRPCNSRCWSCSCRSVASLSSLH